MGDNRPRKSQHKIVTAAKSQYRGPTSDELLSKEHPLGTCLQKVVWLPKPRPSWETTGVCTASMWDTEEVSQWSASRELPEVSSAVGHHDIPGGKLLRTDALALQKLGVSSFREALLAEEYICRLAKSVDLDASDGTGHPIEMYKSIYRGEEACLGYSPLDLLTTDPWVDNRLRFMDTSDHCNMRWMGMDHSI